jgi:methanogenic corrinoid protein MtbC1
LSPKQAAKAIGVSESSLKRWCDQGLIETIRTVGGHRKLPISNLIRFVRERDKPIIRGEILGLSLGKSAEIGLDRGWTTLAEALLNGDEALARQVIFEFYLAKDSISEICDEVICKAFREIGHRWEVQTAEVYQERRSCEIVQRILFELRRTQSDPDACWTACGGTFEGDEYCLPTTMVELVLRDAGWNATSLGSSIPAESMTKAILATSPKMFWVCASYIRDIEKFVTDFKSLWQVAQANGTALVIGGRAFTEDLRAKLTYCCYCDTMQQLEAFAKSMHHFGSAQRE